MKLQSNSSAYRYALIVCLSIALLLSQTFKAHVHLHHDNFSGSAHQHTVDLHVDINHSDHNETNDILHHEDALNHQNHAEIDVSSESLVKKIKQTDLSVLLFLIIAFVLFTPRIQRDCKRYLCKAKPISLYYLFQPPLRAPPVKQI